MACLIMSPCLLSLFHVEQWRILTLLRKEAIPIEIVNDIFETIGTVITQFAQVLGNGFSGVISIFYNEGGLTVVGTLSLIALGVGLVYWAFRIVQRLIRQR